MAEQKSDLSRAFSEDGALKTHVGGQALIEGIMMRGKYNWSVAVREPSGGIYVEEHDLASGRNKNGWMHWPLVRGCRALVESLVLGYKALEIAAMHAFGEEEPEEPAGQTLAAGEPVSPPIAADEPASRSLAADEPAPLPIAPADGLASNGGPLAGAKSGAAGEGGLLRGRKEWGRWLRGWGCGLFSLLLLEGRLWASRHHDRCAWGAAQP